MTPVLILAFNRTSCIEQLATRLRDLGATHVYLSIDGARHNRVGEDHVVREVHTTARKILGSSIIEERVGTRNLGCASAVHAGLTWFFERQNAGIVLEDDCLPTLEFIDFCSRGLTAYADDHSIGAICGVNYAPPSIFNGRPVARTRFFPLWGWATWRRSIAGFEVQSPDWYKSASQTKEWRSLTLLERRDWKRMFRSAGEASPHTWDYQFVLHQWINGSDCVVPVVPLVENIGFSDGAHFSDGPPGYYYMSSQQQRDQMLDALSRTEGLMPERLPQLDKWISRHVFSPPLSFRTRRRVKMLRKL